MSDTLVVELTVSELREQLASAKERIRTLETKLGGLCKNVVDSQDVSSWEKVLPETDDQRKHREDARNAAVVRACQYSMELRRYGGA